MGNPASDERLEFANLGVDCGNNRTWHVCKHCDQVYRNSKQIDGTYSLPEPKRIKGRIENFKSHLKRCPAYIGYVQANTTSNTPLEYVGSSNEVAGEMSAKRQRTIDEFYVGISQADEMKLLIRYILEFQADNNLPDSFIERQTTARMLRHANKMSGGIDPLPKRKTFGDQY
ncbi:hypothetical protein GN244_ATG11532 [Phytophthora infestans]|uniref:Uncharacterized protein n=1 Tax=Phytophthora infestans TaxID=4787 RepID=A0A833SLK6_PHYIN|nr:hypothetical protein GN244_ATG14846 [Phytophthora infestans]KAF4036422.1 hypothetical protein GN244_ATG11532 [Phytophthora infestans]